MPTTKSDDECLLYRVFQLGRRHPEVRKISPHKPEVASVHLGKIRSACSVRVHRACTLLRERTLLSKNVNAMPRPNLSPAGREVTTGSARSSTENFTRRKASGTPNITSNISQSSRPKRNRTDGTMASQ